MKKALIREMVEQYLLQEVSIKKQKHPFKAILMTGPAGAGKSFTSKNLLGIPAEVRRFTLNPDEIIEDIFPRFGLPLNFIQDEDDPVGAAQQEMRKLAQIATKSKAAGYINRAKPLYFDTTGENPAKMIPVLEQLIELGYDVGIIKVSVPKETSVGRDQKRDRTVGEEVTDKIWS
jgi:dephospho-CoA kinase